MRWLCPECGNNMGEEFTPIASELPLFDEAELAAGKAVHFRKCEDCRGNI